VKVAQQRTCSAGPQFRPQILQIDEQPVELVPASCAPHVIRDVLKDVSVRRDVRPLARVTATIRVEETIVVGRTLAGLDLDEIHQQVMNGDMPPVSVRFNSDESSPGEFGKRPSCLAFSYTVRAPECDNCSFGNRHAPRKHGERQIASGHFAAVPPEGIEADPQRAEQCLMRIVRQSAFDRVQVGCCQGIVHISPRHALSYESAAECDTQGQIVAAARNRRCFGGCLEIARPRAQESHRLRLFHRLQPQLA
jgi:hypothetical protein